MVDDQPDDKIPMTPADAGLHLAGLAAAEALKPRRKRDWEKFGRLAAYMIETAFQAGRAAPLGALVEQIATRRFACRPCAEAEPDRPAEVVLDGADADAVTEVRCVHCGEAMREVIEE